MDAFDDAFGRVILKEGGYSDDPRDSGGATTYGIKNLSFGPEYLIPKPFDPRLIVKIAPAVAQAAIDAGVATRPIEDFDAYRQKLQQFVYHSGTLMKPVFAAARKLSPDRSRVIYAEGEEERVLRAAQIAVDEKLARPILVGRPAVIAERIQRYGLRLREDEHYTVVNPENDHRYREYWQEYHQLMCRRGITEPYARLEMRRRNTLIASMLLKKGEGDAMLCGTVSTAIRHLEYIDHVIGLRGGAGTYAAMNALILQDRQVFIVDTHINPDPSAEQLAEITIMAASAISGFGIAPKAALLSHSNFGSLDTASSRKMRETLALVQRRAPGLEIDGEMHGDCALDEKLRLLVMPNLDSANIAYNLLKTAAGNNVAIGPMLLGAAAPVHILTPSATVRRILNMTAIAVVQANTSA